MSLMARPLRIVLAGSIAAVPGHGGWTWALLQYVLGLRQLGHEVCWIDPICADALVPAGVPFTDSRNAAYFRQVAARFSVSECSTLLLQGASPDTIGRPLHALLDICRKRRIPLAPGQIILAGAATAALPLTVGVTACHIAGLGTVTLKGL